MVPSKIQRDRQRLKGDVEWAGQKLRSLRFAEKHAATEVVRYQAYLEQVRRDIADAEQYRK